jgi:hypothetical protein
VEGEHTQAQDCGGRQAPVRSISVSGELEAISAAQQAEAWPPQVVDTLPEKHALCCIVATLVCQLGSFCYVSLFHPIIDFCHSTCSDNQMTSLHHNLLV